MLFFTTGYLGDRTPKGDPKAARLRQMVMEQDWIVADIRDVPWSQAPCWRKAALEQILGGRYVHIPQLGNATKRTGQITIRDMEAGLDRVLAPVRTGSTSYAPLIRDMEAGLDRVLALPRPALLLCCCPNFFDCHREEVARALVKRPGVTNIVEITHWEPMYTAVPIFGGDREGSYA